MTNGRFSLIRDRIVISTDPFTGRCPSYCFVELATKQHADLAIEQLNGTEMLGRNVNVKHAVPRTSRGGAEGHNDFRSNRPEANRTAPAFNRWERTDASSHFRAEQGCRLYVSGFPRMPDQNAVEVEVKKIFEGFTMFVFRTLF